MTNTQPRSDVICEPQEEDGYTVYVPTCRAASARQRHLKRATAMIQEAM
jgi:hypothetical protein